MSLGKWGMFPRMGGKRRDPDSYVFRPMPELSNKGLNKPKGKKRLLRADIDLEDIAFGPRKKKPLKPD